MARVISRNLTRNQLLWFYGVTVTLSFIVFVIIWYTSILQNVILSTLEIKNGTKSFYMWQRPPVGMIHEIYVFNYTNADEYLAGNTSKLRVQEVGPYIYKEKMTRVNVELHENGTVTYQEKRSFEWIAGRPENETVIVPNVPLIATVAFFKDIPYFAQVGLTVFLATLKSKPFIELPVGGYLWGYDDGIFKIGKTLQMLKRKVSFDKFGILAFKTGLNADRITMHTGENDLGHLGMIQSINGAEDRKIWGDKNCDRVYGTDGSMFPPHLIDDSNTTIYIYAKDICRRIPFRYVGTVYSRGIPALRYKMPRDVFTATPTKDSCFCNHKTKDLQCPPAGILNVSVCNFESPMLLSFPHFYAADKRLLDKIDGLNPRQDQHESYLDLHPRLALPVNGQSRMQLNIQVHRAVGVATIPKTLEDGLILPLIWLDSGIDTFPEWVQRDLHRAHYTANAVETGLQWGSLIAVLIFMGAFLNASRKQTRDPPLEEKPPERLDNP